MILIFFHELGPNQSEEWDDIDLAQRNFKNPIVVPLLDPSTFHKSKSGASLGGHAMQMHHVQFFNVFFSASQMFSLNLSSELRQFMPSSAIPGSGQNGQRMPMTKSDMPKRS